MKELITSLSEVGASGLDREVEMYVKVSVLVPIKFSARNGRVTGALSPTFADVAKAAQKKNAISRLQVPSLRDIEKEAKLSGLLESDHAGDDEACS